MLPYRLDPWSNTKVQRAIDRIRKYFLLGRWPGHRRFPTDPLKTRERKRNRTDLVQKVVFCGAVTLLSYCSVLGSPNRRSGRSVPVLELNTTAIHQARYRIHIDFLLHQLTAGILVLRDLVNRLPNSWDRTDPYLLFP